MNKYEQVIKILDDFYLKKSNLVDRFQYGLGATKKEFKQLKDDAFKNLEYIFIGEKIK